MRFDFRIAVWCGCLAALAVGAAEPAPRSPVLLIGDSMMRLPGLAIERELSRLPNMKARSFADIGTGLARLDVFDWLGKISELCDVHRPRVGLVALGTNDRQPMQLAGGRGMVQPETPEWDAEYAQRIGQAMDRLLAGGCERVIWLLLPPMRDAVIDRFVKRLNTLVMAEAEHRPQVLLFDVGKLVADRKTGGFTERLIDPRTAVSVSVRDRDGIHLTPEGARLLASALIREYWP
ncbi:MAG: hypothetical protein A2498_09480 [Lentisphaerae bacterium RIFOXYC12_FULL_60_16]|nr:MAG: hypothetical protein A2498_09480 [Lentisphaerae bacterium RIFOXYC12_FULL_60_16]OGV73310.1 MAG: hypothetical protein A2269_06390 [Lentisphaerae bacterium RIFOXYA12_FULL_60_10]OGV75390.1 MAG: hypothetical protein A2340_13320 [Lentisphaerae bacterium RIFOXYB12_FULL_60_10]